MVPPPRWVRQRAAIALQRGFRQKLRRRRATVLFRAQARSRMMMARRATRGKPNYIFRAALARLPRPRVPYVVPRRTGRYFKRWNRTIGRYLAPSRRSGWNRYRY